jgi:transposase
MDLTDEQWGAIEPFIPARERRAPGKQGGRPWRSPREVLNGVLWVLRTGAPWVDLPPRYPPYQTCHRRYQRWVEKGLFKKILRALAHDLRERGRLDLTEVYIDGSHAGAKRGALALDELAAARRPRSWQWQTALVFLSPLGLEVVSDMRRSSSSPPSSSDSSTSCLSA